MTGKGMAESERDTFKGSLEAANAECVRLREMILNVAVAIESAGLTPSKAMQTEVNKAKEDTARPTSQASPASEVAGSGSTSGSDGSTGGAGESEAKPAWSDKPFWEGQPRDPATGQFRSPYHN
jgi:hypothetical protein